MDSASATIEVPVVGSVSMIVANSGSIITNGAAGAAVFGKAITRKINIGRR
jgi:hypothetical protein